MVISINCMVGLSDELVGSFVEVVVPTTPNHHRQQLCYTNIQYIFIPTSEENEPGVHTSYKPANVNSRLVGGGAGGERAVASDYKYVTKKLELNMMDESVSNRSQNF